MITKRNGDALEDDYIVDDSYQVEDIDDGVVVDEAPSAEAPKKAKKNKKMKKALPKDNETQTKSSASRDPRRSVKEECDHLHSVFRKLGPSLSTFELDECAIKQENLLDTSSLANDLSLSQFFQQSQIWTGNQKEQVAKRMTSLKGCPHILVMTASGQRAADLVRDLKGLQLRCAKLFAKHMKIKDQVRHLESSEIDVGVATAQRASDLIQSNALGLDNLAYIVLDGYHKDLKERTLLDANDVTTQLITFLRLPQIQSRLGGQLRIAVF